ncbi:cytochrome P450 [Tanacetum coccineum]
MELKFYSMVIYLTHLDDDDDDDDDSIRIADGATGDECDKDSGADSDSNYDNNNRPNNSKNSNKNSKLHPKPVIHSSGPSPIQPQNQNNPAKAHFSNGLSRSPSHNKISSLKSSTTSRTPNKTRYSSVPITLCQSQSRHPLQRKKRYASLNDNNIHFMGLQETMSEEISNITVKSLWGNPFFDFATKPSNGKSGGILAIWDKRKFTPISSSIGDGFLAVLGWWQSVEVPCLFVVVYAPQNQRKKRKLWTDIESIIASHDTISIIMGDFNEVRNVAER